MSRLSSSNRFLQWFFPRPKALEEPPQRQRLAQDHVVILDGTMSSNAPGHETNAALLYRLLEAQAPKVKVYYRPGQQWIDLRSGWDVLVGGNMNTQIRRAYGALATRFWPTDRIYLFGYSRGAYAVRSLSGMINHVGLLKREYATPRHIQQAWRLYQTNISGAVLEKFRAAHCHDVVEIEMIGVWDTVRALGLPIISRWRQARYGFHNHALSPVVKAGYQALALNEARIAFSPVKWECSAQPDTRVQQVWFRGNHGDVGGHLGGFFAARRLSNIPLIWMLERAENHGLVLPKGWQQGYPIDPKAPSTGPWRGIGKLFFLRKKRRVDLSCCESIHPSAEP